MGGRGKASNTAHQRAKLQTYLLKAAQRPDTLAGMLTFTALRIHIVYGITDPLTFLIGTIFVVLLPGPNSMFVLTVASMLGVSSGYRAASGVFVGDSLLMLMTAMGAASVLYANPTLFTILKYAGAGYLAYIGVGLTRAAWQNWRDPQVTGRLVRLQKQDLPTTQPANTSHSKQSAGLRHPFRRALFVSLINPKAIFFFLSFFVQFVDTRYDKPALTFFALGVIVQICSFLYLSALIFAGARLAHLVRSNPRLSALASAGVGLLFLFFGARLADASLRAI